MIEELFISCFCGSNDMPILSEVPNKSSWFPVMNVSKITERPIIFRCRISIFHKTVSKYKLPNPYSSFPKINFTLFAYIDFQELFINIIILYYFYILLNSNTKV